MKTSIATVSISDRKPENFAAIAATGFNGSATFEKAVIAATIRDAVWAL